jgi:hypothetical protein
MDVTVAGKKVGGTPVGIEYGVSDTGVSHVSKAGHEVSDLAGTKLGRLVSAQLEVAHLIHLIQIARVRAEADRHSLA